MTNKTKMDQKYIINQITLLFNDSLLLDNGWEIVKRENHIYDWFEYEKSWMIQDAEGGIYKISVSLRAHENIAYLYIQGGWVGRCLYLKEAEKIVKAIKSGCK